MHRLLVLQILVAVIVTGCAHPGIVEMITKAKELFDRPVYLVVGGFHLGDKSRNQLRNIIAEFRRLGVQKVSPTHCTGEEAIALTRIESPCLIVMDIRLPGMNGIETTRRIKAALPCAQIVMLTILEGNSYRAEATSAGASAYVQKQRMHSELVPTMAGLLANAAPGGQTAHHWRSQLGDG